MVLPLDELAFSLRTQLPSVTLRKALDLLEAGKVTVLVQNRRDLTAAVMGTRDYIVELSSTAEGVTMFCTCEAFLKWGPCKHVLATVLEAQADDPFEFDPGSGNVSPAALEWRRKATRAPWRGRVTNLANRSSSERIERWQRAVAARDEVLLYEVSLGPDKTSFGLAVRVARRTRTGTTRGTIRAIDVLALTELRDRRDRRIIRIAQRSRADRSIDDPFGDQPQPIRSADAARLARLLAQTGRCTVQLARSRAKRGARLPLAVARGGPWHADFERKVHDSADMVEMTGRLVREGEAAETPTPTPTPTSTPTLALALGEVDCWLGDGDFLVRGEIHELADARAMPWLRNLEQDGALYVPTDELAEFEATVLAQPAAPRELVTGELLPGELAGGGSADAIDGAAPVPATPEPFVVDPLSVGASLLAPLPSDPSPAALLALSQPTTAPSAPSPPTPLRAPPSREPVGPRAPALPVLMIGDPETRQRRVCPATLSFEYGTVRLAEQSTTTVQRDLDAEDAAALRLLDVDGVSVPRGGGLHETGVFEFEIDRSQLHAVVTSLLDAGWAIEVHAEKVQRAGEFSASVSSGQDWFDLEAGVDYGGEVVPLPEVLRAAKAGESFVRLRGGGRGLLPHLQSDVWDTLAAFGKDRDGTVRFDRSQGWLLDALLASRMDVAVDAEFSAYRERLAAFGGIAPRNEPDGFHGELRDYQRDGLGWFDFLAEFGWGGCLADDMGLGKTVQVLALLERRRQEGCEIPSLVVAPRSVVFNWIDEALRFAPELKVLDHTGITRKRTVDAFTGYDLVLTTYGTLRRDAQILSKCEFDYAVLDEAQNVKNASSQAAKAARLLRARHRLALTGTPVENRLSDLWSLFEFLNPGMLGRVTKFKKWTKQASKLASAHAARRAADADAILDSDSAFDSDRGVDSDAAADPAHHPLAALSRALRPFVLRRTKEQVATELPERTEQVVHCDMPTAQRKLYGELRDHYRSLLLADAAERQKSGETLQVLEALLRLRQAACHTALVEKGTEGESGKLDTLMEMLPEAITGHHKALVFSQFTSLLALVRKRLDAAGVRYLYLDGATTKRKDLVDRFQSDPELDVFLISLKAGGTGLNLTAADYVFLLDPWWNPAVEAQAVDRAHRIGQDRPVMAYRLVSTGTVEERVLELQHAKRALASAIVTQDNASLSELSREDLSTLLS